MKKPCGISSGRPWMEIENRKSGQMEELKTPSLSRFFIKCIFLENKKSARRDSNPRPRPWQGRTPPTEPLAHKRVMGIEPTYPAWKAGVHRGWKKKIENLDRRKSLKLQVCPDFLLSVFFKKIKKARDGTRTRGLDFGKVALHQLSHSRISG